MPWSSLFLPRFSWISWINNPPDYCKSLIISRVLTKFILTIFPSVPVSLFGGLGFRRSLLYHSGMFQIPIILRFRNNSLPFWDCDGSGSPDDFWIAFRVISPLSSKIASGFFWDDWSIVNLCRFSTLFFALTPQEPGRQPQTLEQGTGSGDEGRLGRMVCSHFVPVSDLWPKSLESSRYSISVGELIDSSI